MPRYPELSTPVGAIPSSIFTRLYAKAADYPGEKFLFHIGDTHLAPPPETRLETISWDERACGPLYTYGAPIGDADLMSALVDKLARKNGIAASPANLQITIGATQAFACAARALLDAHDEVLLCAPYWPLIRGHVLAAGARPVEVPFTSRLYEDPDVDVRALLDEYVTPRTAAIYLINPNNPDGKVLRRRDLEAICDVARAVGLWVLSDEVYEDYTFDGRPHVSIASLPGMAERTVTVFSFSKSYALAGIRVGYVVAPVDTTVAIRKLALHTSYNTPRAMQRAALTALSRGDEFLAAARAEYAAARDATLARLTVPHHAPEGGSYVFVDLSARARGGSAIEVLERLAASGVLLAPGDAFGRAYAGWARLCYTAVSRDRLLAGLDRMAEVLEND